MAKKTSGKWAVGALVAGAAGYLAGILTAPKSGKETRKDIHDTALRAKKEAEKKLKKLHAELNELLDKGKKTADSFTKKVKAEYDDVASKATNARDRAKVLLSAIHEGEAEDKELQKAIDEAKKASEHLKKFLATHDKAKSSKK